MLRGMAQMLPEKLPCLVCGNLTITARGAFDICPVCHWEDEGDIKNADIPSHGPNGVLSLQQARLNFKKYGAVEEQFVDLVRAAQTDGIPKRL